MVKHEQQFIYDLLKPGGLTFCFGSKRLIHYDEISTESKFKPTGTRGIKRFRRL